MTWFQIWTVCWQVAIVVTPLIVTMCMLWLRSQFVSKVDFASERARVDGLLHAVDAKFATEKVERDGRYDRLKEFDHDHEARLRLVENEIKRPPTRHELNNAVQSASAGVHSLGKSLDQLRNQMEARDEAMQRQLETTNNYLHTIIEKRMS